MQIKKFRANDTSEALRIIRKEFGSQAVILSSKDVEIGSSVFGLRKKYGVEVTAATDAEPPKSTVRTTSEFGRKKRSFRKLNSKNLAGQDLPKSETPTTPSGAERGLNRIGRIKPVKLRKSFSRGSNRQMRFFSLYKELQDQGVKERTAMEVVEQLSDVPSLKGPFEEEDLRRGVGDILRKLGVAASPIKFVRGEQTIVAMVGPAGVGKTTTLAKLVGMGALRQERKLGMITLDDRKIGAVGEFQVYSRIFDVPMEVAFSRRDLERALHNFRSKDIILIDTPGISGNENGLFRRIQDLLQNVRSAEIHLLLNAVTPDTDLKTILNRFKPMNLNRLIFTGVDNRGEYGHLINCLIESGIPASYFTNGPHIPENIKVASIERLVKMVLTKKHAGKNEALFSKPKMGSGVESMTYGPYREKSYACS